MLNADSSTLKSESDVHSSAAPPTTPRAAACFCTARMVWTMLSIELPGKARFSSVTRKVDSSGRPASASSDTVRNSSGTNDNSAKYAIIAARCGPRSPKNFPSGCGKPSMDRSMGGALAVLASVPMATATSALADLTEISTQIEAAVVFDREGTVIGSTVDDERAGRLAATALELLTAADEARP